MKSTKTFIAIFSFALLTLSSGLLFYRSLFELDQTNNKIQVELEDLKLIDTHLSSTILLSKKNINADLNLLETDTARLKDLIFVLGDLEKDSPAFAKRIKSIRDYFEIKYEIFSKYRNAIKSLKDSHIDLDKSFNSIQKNRLKFNVDGQDLYAQSMIDILGFQNNSQPFYLTRINEHLKILNQIVVFSKKPNPILENFTRSIQNIVDKNKEIDELIVQLSIPSSISDDLAVINRYFKENQIEKEKKGEKFLYLVFGAIFSYLIAIFSFLGRKN